MNARSALTKYCTIASTARAVDAGLGGLGADVRVDLEVDELDRLERLVLAGVAREQRVVQRLDHAHAPALDLDLLIALEHLELDERATVEILDHEPVQLELEDVATEHPADERFMWRSVHVAESSVPEHACSVNVVWRGSAGTCGNSGRCWRHMERA